MIINISRSKQNGRYFADDIFTEVFNERFSVLIKKCHRRFSWRHNWHYVITFPRRHFKCLFINENVGISIKISLKFVPKGSTYNIPPWVQKMAWRPVSELMVSLLTHICVNRSQWVIWTNFITSALPSWNLKHTALKNLKCRKLSSNPVGHVGWEPLVINILWNIIDSPRNWHENNTSDVLTGSGAHISLHPALDGSSPLGLWTPISVRYRCGRGSCAYSVTTYWLNQCWVIINNII